MDGRPRMARGASTSAHEPRRTAGVVLSTAIFVSQSQRTKSTRYHTFYKTLSISPL